MAKTVNTVLKLKDQFSAPMKKTTKSVEAFNLQAKKGNYDVKKLSRNLKTNLVAGAKVAAKAMAGATVAVMAMGVKYNAEMENYQANFKVMLGSEEKAIKKVNDLKKMAAKTPFEMSDLADATQTLLSFGVANKDTQNALEMLGDVSLGNKEKFSGLALVYGQVQSQGKLMGQDLLQMINNGFNPLQIISEKTGKSMAELKDQMSKGAISADMVTQAFQWATEKGGKFYGGMEEGSKTFSGQLSTLKDNINALAGEIAGPLTKSLTSEGIPKAIKLIEKVQTNLPKIKKFLGDMIPVLAGVVSGIAAFKVITTVTTLINTWKTVTTAYAAAQGLANASMLACPLTWIVLGIAAVVAAGVALWKNWDKVCAWADKLKDKFLKLIKPIKDAYNWLKKVLGLDGKSTNITVSKNTTSSSSKGGTGGAGSRRGHATGTSYFAGGYTGFSEGGRKESAIFPSGTQIIPASKTGKDEPKGMTVYVTVQGNMIGNETAMEKFAEYTGRKIISAMGNV